MNSDEGEMVDAKRERKDHKMLNLSLKKNYPGDFYEYNISIEKGNDKTNLYIQGIENGLSIDFFFEMRNGKWMLVYFEDNST